MKKEKKPKKPVSDSLAIAAAIIAGVVIFYFREFVDPEVVTNTVIVTGLTVLLTAIVGAIILVRKDNKAKTDKEKQREEELKNLDTEKLDALISEIKIRTAQSAYRIKMSESGDISIFDSKLGGLPYWPNSMDYPLSKNGEKLVLLAQINFDKAKLHDYRLPKHGLLQFFILGDDLSGVNYEDPFAQENFRVVYHAELDRSVTAESVRALGIKANTDFDGTEDYLPSYDEMLMSFEGMTDYMTDSVDEFDELAAHVYRELFDEDLVQGSLWRTLNSTEYDYFYDGFQDCTFGHKMLGYPSFTQSDPRCGEYQGEYETLLLQIDSQDDIMWGDSGIANFFINEKDLRKLDFSNVMYTWDCY